MKVKENIILYNKEVKDGYFVMGIKTEELKDAKPGQFISLSVKGIEKNMPLRRPFTIYRLEENLVEILYKVVGRGTEFYSKLGNGDSINILGPLGNGFKEEKYDRAILIGRGSGLASLAYQGKMLKESGCNVITVASFKNDQVNFIDDYIKSFSDELIILKDDDGTSSMENLKSIIEERNPDVIYTGGSKRILRLIQKLQYKAYVNLEERMGCGLGSCLTCPVKTPTGYKRVCKDGPCFDVREVII